MFVVGFLHFSLLEASPLALHLIGTQNSRGLQGMYILTHGVHTAQRQDEKLSAVQQEPLQLDFTFQRGSRLCKHFWGDYERRSCQDSNRALSSSRLNSRTQKGLGKAKPWLAAVLLPAENDFHPERKPRAPGWEVR